MNETLGKLQAANPEMGLLPVSAPGFEQFGRLLDAYDPTEVAARAKAILPRSDKVVYEATVRVLEQPSRFNAAIARRVFGGMPVQVGWCHGKNLRMAGLEYHKGNEVLVCLADVVLLVGDVRDIVFGDEITYDAAEVQAFYAPEGSVIELHSWCLHFAPIHVEEEGSFATLVYLPRTTNEPLTYSVERVGESKLLFAINKWLIVHPGATALVDEGAYPGITGEDIYLKPV